MVKFLRVLGREPLRSASRRLEFIIGFFYWGPGYGLSADPTSASCRLQDPVGRHALLDPLAPLAPLALFCPCDPVTVDSIRITKSRWEGCA